MNRPTPDPSQERSWCSSAYFLQFPSWEGLGVGSWSRPTSALAQEGSSRSCASSQFIAPMHTHTEKGGFP